MVADRATPPPPTITLFHQQTRTDISFNDDVTVILLLSNSYMPVTIHVLNLNSHDPYWVKKTPVDYTQKGKFSSLC